MPVTTRQRRKLAAASLLPRPRAAVLAVVLTPGAFTICEAFRRSFASVVPDVSTAATFLLSAAEFYYAELSKVLGEGVTGYVLSDPADPADWYPGIAPDPQHIVTITGPIVDWLDDTASNIIEGVSLVASKHIREVSDSGAAEWSRSYVKAWVREHAALIAA